MKKRALVLLMPGVTFGLAAPAGAGPSAGTVRLLRHRFRARCSPVTTARRFSLPRSAAASASIRPGRPDTPPAPARAREYFRYSCTAGTCYILPSATFFYSRRDVQLNVTRTFSGSGFFLPGDARLGRLHQPCCQRSGSRPCSLQGLLPRTPGDRPPLASSRLAPPRTPRSTAPNARATSTQTSRGSSPGRTPCVGVQARRSARPPEHPVTG